MAQIIRHRKGVLESVSGATKRKAELLIVTGSSGITSTNSSAMVFFGDGTDATPANKIIFGTSTPDLSGASYSTAVDGIPYYNTNDEKLYILRKSGGNVEVKATANTNGTGILSGSANAAGNLSTAIKDLGDNIYSSSAQVAADLLTDNRNIDLGTGTFDAGTITSDGTLNVTGLSNLGVISGSSLDLTGNANIQGNLVLGGNITIGDASADTISFGGEISSDIIPSANNTYDLGSATDKFAEVHATSLFGAINATNGVVSGSAQTLVNVNAAIPGVISGSTQLDGTTIGSTSDASFIGTFTGTVNAENGVVSGSTQTIEHLGGSGVVSGSTQLDGTALGTTSDIQATGSFTGSFTGDGSGLTGLATNLKISSSDDGTNDEVDLLSDALSFAGTANEVDVTVTNNTITFGLPNDVTIAGNLTVSGTTTTVDSTTVNIGDNIIELNGSGAALGGIYVGDVTSPGLSSGSILWDGANNYWIAGVSGSESKVLLAGGDDVVSGSAQITLTQTDSGSFTTDMVGEGASNLYYTDARVKTKLDAETVVSGSSQVTTEAAASEVLIRHASNGTIDGASIYSDPANALIAINNSGASGLGTTGELVINGTSANYSGILSLTEAGTNRFSLYADAIDNVVNYAAGSGYGHNFYVDGGFTKGFYVDTDGDLIALGNGDMYARRFVATGDISGSNLFLSGNAVIDGNITLGGNINIGDATGDSIAFNGELTTDIIPDVNNTVDLGSTSRVFAEIHGTTIFGSISANNGVVSGSSQTIGHLEGTGVISGSAQLLNVATDFGTGRVSGDNFGDAAGTSTFTGSFVGDGSGLTGLSTDLTIADALGNTNAVDLINDTLTFNSGSGATGIEVTVGTDTVSVTGVDASTSGKGVASFDSDDFTVTSGNVVLKAGDGSTTSGGVRGANLNADTAGDGLTYSLSNQQLDVDYGSTANTAVQGNTTLTVAGTTNEIEITSGSVTLGSGGTVTIGLPDDVTVGNDLTVSNDLSVTGNATITGNLSVLGTTTTIDSTTVSIGDNILELNIGGAQSTAGLQVTDATGGSTTSGSLLWDGTNDYWKGGALGSEKEFARLNAAPTSGSVQVIGADGLLVDSSISDDGTDATFSGDIIVNGLTPGANGGFLYVDTANTIQSVQATTAGDVIQWDGSSFVAANALDGGTF